MNMNLTAKVLAGFKDKDSKRAKYRNLYKKHDFLIAYSKHTDIRVQENPRGAIGREDEWVSHGILQRDFLIELGLLPKHRLLDIGCGVGRASRRFVPYLHPGNYTGIDISEKALIYARHLARIEGWGKRNPKFLINSDLKFNKDFDFLWAHSVFTHLPDKQIEKMILNAADIVRYKFAFTYKIAEKPQRSGLKQFQFPVSFFKKIAKKAGFTLEDNPTRWPAGQRTIVLTKI